MRRELGVPVGPAGFTPTGFVNACKLRNRSPERMTAFFESARVCTLLRSKKSSLKAMAAGLSAWAKCCDLSGTPEFPIEAEDVVSFSVVCRNHGTFPQYVSHLSAAREILGHPTEWRKDGRITRATNGIKKEGILHREPKLAVSRRHVVPLALNMADAAQERIFCLLSWAFLLRARSEASFLRRASPGSFLEPFQPVESQGEIDLVEDALVIRLRSRKNRLGGDAISRSCSCHATVSTSSHIPPQACPAHVLWPWIKARAGPGDAIFKENIAQSAQTWLKVALEVRRVPYASKFTLHTLRRGAARALVASGCSLATILQAGSWRSSAFIAYLDTGGMENALLPGSLTELFDNDELDD